jgi:hypothetical protein
MAVNGINGHNGHERKRTASQEVIDLARQLETMAGQRDRALAAVLALRESIRQTGGYTSPVQQRVMRDVDAMLEEAGLLKSERAQWTNRG